MYTEYECTNYMWINRVNACAPDPTQDSAQPVGHHLRRMDGMTGRPREQRGCFTGLNMRPSRWIDSPVRLWLHGISESGTLVYYIEDAGWPCQPFRLRVFHFVCTLHQHRLVRPEFSCLTARLAVAKEEKESDRPIMTEIYENLYSNANTLRHAEQRKRREVGLFVGQQTEVK